MKLLSPVLCCFVLSVVIRISTCYPSGAPSSSCNTMIPNHGAQPKTSTPPYGIQLSATTYCGDSTVTVTLVGNPQNTEFKGFLCQPRTDPSTYETVGTFSQPTSTKYTCGNNAALTHTNRNPKTSVQFTWTPDSSVKETVHIVCTVVQQLTAFWTQVSSSITYAGDSECQSPGGLPTTCSGDGECDNAVSMSVCQQGTCVCPSDRKLADPTDTNCSPKVLNDDCTNDSECKFIRNSKCIDGTCGCPVDDFVEVQNSTHSTCSTSRLPTTCSGDEECENTVSMSVCQQGTCVCPSDRKIANPTDTNCSPKVLNDDCMNDNECKFISNSKCIDGTCGCPVAGFVEVQNSTHTTCSTSSLPVTCTNDEDCDNEVAKSVCKSAQNMANYCACPSNLVLLKPNDKMCSTDAATSVVLSTVMSVGCLVVTLFLI